MALFDGMSDPSVPVFSGGFNAGGGFTGTGQPYAATNPFMSSTALSTPQTDAQGQPVDPVTDLAAAQAPITPPQSAASPIAPQQPQGGVNLFTGGQNAPAQQGGVFGQQASSLMDALYSWHPKYQALKARRQGQALQNQQRQQNLAIGQRNAQWEQYQRERTVRAQQLSVAASEGSLTAMMELRTAFPEKYAAIKTRMTQELQPHAVALNDLANKLSTATTLQDVQNAMEHASSSGPDMKRILDGIGVEELRNNAPLIRQLANDAQEANNAQLMRTRTAQGYTPVPGEGGRGVRKEDVPLQNGVTVSVPVEQDAFGNQRYKWSVLGRKGVSMASPNEVKERRNTYMTSQKEAREVEMQHGTIAGTIENWDQLAGGARDATLINSFQRMLEPGLAVREADITLQMGGRSVTMRVDGWLQLIESGGRFTKPEAETLLRQANIVREQRRKTTWQDRDQAIQWSANRRVTPGQVIAGFGRGVFGDADNEAHGRYKQEAEDFYTGLMDQYGERNQQPATPQPGTQSPPVGASAPSPTSGVAPPEGGDGAAPIIPTRTVRSMAITAPPQEDGVLPPSPQTPSGGQTAAAPQQAATQAQAMPNGVSPQYIDAMEQVESNGRNVRSATSSASGYYQFTNSTWKAVTGLPGPASKYPREVQRRAAQQFTQQNASVLKRNSMPQTPGNLYLMHFLGRSGGPRMIRAPGGEKATGHATPAQVKANRTIFYTNGGKGRARTVDEFRALMNNKVTGATGATGSDGQSVSATMAPGGGLERIAGVSQQTGQPLGGVDEGMVNPQAQPTPQEQQRDAFMVDQSASDLTAMVPESIQQEDVPIRTQQDFAQGTPALGPTGGPEGMVGLGTESGPSMSQRIAGQAAGTRPAAGGLSAEDERELATRQQAVIDETGVTSAEAFGRGAFQGGTMEWGDEAMAALGQEDFNARTEAAREAYPMTTLAGEVVGGIVSGGAVAAGAKVALKGLGLVSGSLAKWLMRAGIVGEGAATGAGIAGEDNRGMGALAGGALSAAAMVGIKAIVGTGKVIANRTNQPAAAGELIESALNGDPKAIARFRDAGVDMNQLRLGQQAYAEELAANRGMRALDRSPTPGSARSASGAVSDRFGPVSGGRSTMNVGGAATGAVQEVAEGHRAAGSAAFDAARANMPNIAMGTPQTIMQDVHDALSVRNASIVQGGGSAYARNAVNILEKNGDMLFDANGRVNYAGFRNIMSSIKSEKAAATMAGDTNAARQVKIITNTLEDGYAGALNRELASVSPNMGARGREAMQSLQRGNAEWTQYRRITNLRTKDSVDKVIANIAQANQTPEQLSNMLLGSALVGENPVSRAVVKRLKGLVGGNSGAFRAIRSETMSRVFHDMKTGEVLSPADITKNLKFYLSGSGKDMAAELFSREERDVMRAVARGLGQEASGATRQALRTAISSTSIALGSTKAVGPFMGTVAAEAFTGSPPLRAWGKLRTLITQGAGWRQTPLGDISRALRNSRAAVPTAALQGAAAVAGGSAVTQATVAPQGEPISTPVPSPQPQQDQFTPRPQQDFDQFVPTDRY